MTNQLNLFLLLFGLLQGFLLALFLFRKKEKDPSFWYFVLILTVASLQMTFKILSKVWVSENAGIGYLMSYKLPFLMGPLLFLFVRSHISKEFHKLDLIHFVPFAVLFGADLFPENAVAQAFLISIYTETV